MLQNRLLSNVSWNVFGNLIARVFAISAQLIVASYLAPEDYGAYAIVVAWLALYEVLKDLGVGQAVILDHNKDNLLSLQFTIQVLTAVVFIVATYLFSPYAADFFDYTELEFLLPLMSLAALPMAKADPLITGFMKVQNYRVLALRQVVNPVVMGIVSIVLVNSGLGVVSLVWGGLAGHVTGTLLLAYNSNERAWFYWNKSYCLSLVSLGKHITFQKISGYVVSQADTLIVSKMLGVASGGLYRIGNLLSLLFTTVIATQSQQVLFSELAKNKNNGEYIAKRYYWHLYPEAC